MPRRKQVAAFRILGYLDACNMHHQMTLSEIRSNQASKQAGSASHQPPDLPDKRPPGQFLPHLTGL